MLRRVLAALGAIVLAALAAFLVLRYAQNADERAQAGLETRDVLVATEPIPAGTPADSVEGLVQTRSVPVAGVAEGVLTDLEGVSGLVLDAPVVPGEPLLRSRFVAVDQQRAAGTAPLPEGTEDLHQVTLLLEKARALGGNIAVGDTVGVFLSFDVLGDEEEGTKDAKTTHLTLHKVVVVRVEGAFVGVPQTQDGEGARAEDQIFVTLALEAKDAERLVFGKEWGQVYLSREPEAAEEDSEVVVMTYPTDVQSVYQ